MVFGKGKESATNFTFKTCLIHWNSSFTFLGLRWPKMNRALPSLQFIWKPVIFFFFFLNFFSSISSIASFRKPGQYAIWVYCRNHYWTPSNLKIQAGRDQNAASEGMQFFEFFHRYFQFNSQGRKNQTFFTDLLENVWIERRVMPWVSGKVFEIASIGRIFGIESIPFSSIEIQQIPQSGSPRVSNRIHNLRKWKSHVRHKKINVARSTNSTLTFDPARWHEIIRPCISDSIVDLGTMIWTTSISLI